MDENEKGECCKSKKNDNNGVIDETREEYSSVVYEEEENDRDIANEKGEYSNSRNSSNSKIFKCEKCHKVSPHKQSHRIMCVTGRDHACKKCNHKFTRKDSLRRHVCKGGKVSVCHTCKPSKDFRTPCGLKRHQKVHLPKCTHCKKIFSDKDLEDHKQSCPMKIVYVKIPMKRMATKGMSSKKKAKGNKPDDVHDLPQLEFAELVDVPPMFEDLVNMSLQEEYVNSTDHLNKWEINWLQSPISEIYAAYLEVKSQMDDHDSDDDIEFSMDTWRPNRTFNINKVSNLKPIFNLLFNSIQLIFSHNEINKYITQPT